MKPLLPADTATHQQRAAAARTGPHYWPFAPLTPMQLRQRAAQQAAMQRRPAP